MSEDEFQEFDAEGLGIDSSLKVRYRFGEPGEKPDIYPEAIRLTFSFVRPSRTMRSYVKYGRFWEREEPPTDEDHTVLMDWAKQELKADLAAALERDPTEPEETRFMPREE